MKARIISKTPKFITVEVNNELLNVTSAGKMHFNKEQLYVGDFVEINPETLQIEGLFPRKNFLIRPVVANVDQVFVVMSLVEPTFSSYLVEKFLTYCHYVNVTPIVILTKSDLVNDEDEIRRVTNYIEKLNVRYFVFDIDKKINKDLTSVLKDKVSVVMGQTGVGKSTRINFLFPHFERSVSEISKKLGRGKHQTKEVIMLNIGDGYLVDTPGFSSFMLPLDCDAIAQNYPLISAYYGKCYFKDCLHLHEKDCKVKEAVRNGLIFEETYNNYVKILNESNTK